METTQKTTSTERSKRYEELRVVSIVATLQRLHKRIEERFPMSSLKQVCKELLTIGEATQAQIEKIRRPNWLLRILGGIAGAGMLYLVYIVFRAALNTQWQIPNGIAPEWIEALEAATNEIILLSLALYFLFSLETRYKRRLALKALHRLRSIAHVVDMHQLTKDPAYIIGNAIPTASSPDREMTAFELVRYLNYSAEMLSLSSKLAALYPQYINDPVVLDAVNDIESLTDGLAVKIWQKIMILDIATPDALEEE